MFSKTKNEPVPGNLLATMNKLRHTEAEKKMGNLDRLLPRRYSIVLLLASVIGSALCGMGCESQRPTVPVKVVPEPREKTAQPREIAVAAASDLKFTLGEIIAAFEARQPEFKVNAAYGSSGSLYSQIVNHAPVDLYLSADLTYPEKLIEQNLAERETLFSYAIGQLVVWAPRTSSLDLATAGIEVLQDPSIQKIALANPKHAPYGRAAEAALKQLGVYDQITSRLVLGENVAQAAQFVESGAADIGLISLSLALAPALRDKGKFWLAPQSAYPPIEQAGVIVKGASNRDGAVQFSKFLLSEESRTLLQTHGFRLPAKE